MYFDLSDLFFLTLILSVVALWWLNLQARETALYYAKRHCKTNELQLLDNNVRLDGFKFGRDTDGRMVFYRRYRFDFSATGDERYTGELVMTGKRVSRITLPPYRIQD